VEIFIEYFFSQSHSFDSEASVAIIIQPCEYVCLDLQVAIDSIGKVADDILEPYVPITPVRRQPNG